MCWRRRKVGIGGGGCEKVQPLPSLQRCVDPQDSCFSCQLPRKRCSNKPTFSCGAVTDISMTSLSSFSTGNLYQPCSDQTDHHDSAGPAEWRVRAGSVGVVGAGVVVFYEWWRGEVQHPSAPHPPAESQHTGCRSTTGLPGVFVRGSVCTSSPETILKFPRSVQFPGLCGLGSGRFADFTATASFHRQRLHSSI